MTFLGGGGGGCSAKAKQGNASKQCGKGERALCPSSSFPTTLPNMTLWRQIDNDCYTFLTRRLEQMVMFDCSFF